MFEAKGLAIKFAAIGSEDEDQKKDFLFKDVSFKLEKGEILALRGPSGCGKTTLLKCLAELMPYDRGTSLLDGKPAKDFGVPNWRTQVMYVPQRPALLAGTPKEFFDHVLEYKSQQKRDHNTDPVTLSADWGIRSDLWSSPWSQLSGGESQRVALAIALALEPRVLLLDGKLSDLKFTRLIS